MLRNYKQRRETGLERTTSFLSVSLFFVRNFFAFYDVLSKRVYFLCWESLRSSFNPACTRGHGYCIPCTWSHAQGVIHDSWRIVPTRQNQEVKTMSANCEKSLKTTPLKKKMSPGVGRVPSSETSSGSRRPLWAQRSLLSCSCFTHENINNKNKSQVFKIHMSFRLPSERYMFLVFFCNVFIIQLKGLHVTRPVVPRNTKHTEYSWNLHSYLNLSRQDLYTNPNIAFTFGCNV